MIHVVRLILVWSIWLACLALALSAALPTPQRICLRSDGTFHAALGCSCVDCTQPITSEPSAGDCCGACTGETGLATKCCTCSETEMHDRLVLRRSGAPAPCMIIAPVSELFAAPVAMPVAPSLNLLAWRYPGASPPLVLRM